MKTSARPECSDENYGPAMPDDEALRLIAKSVAKRRGLIRGKLDGKKGAHCALGCFWADHPDATLNAYLVEEVALVNDAMSARVKPKSRWVFVNKWLKARTKDLPV